MGSNNGFVCFLLFATVATLASSAHISNDVFQPRESVGRALLQEKTNCPLDFDSMDYTVITSRCEAPTFNSSECCAGFTDFACPITSYLNDDMNGCSSAMFSNINLRFKFPPGLFSNCAESNDGIKCPSEEEMKKKKEEREKKKKQEEEEKKKKEEDEKKKSGGVSVKPTRSPMTIAAAGLVILLLKFV